MVMPLIIGGLKAGLRGTMVPGIGKFKRGDWAYTLDGGTIELVINVNAKRAENIL